MSTQGSGFNDGGVLAFTSGGALDTGFSGTGFHDLDLEEGTRIDEVTFQSDGKLLAVGTINATGSHTAGFLLARLTTAGTRDGSYDGNGVKRVEFDRTENAQDFGFTAITWGGRLLAAGTAQGAALESAFALVRTQSALIFTDGFASGGTTMWDAQ